MNRQVDSVCKAILSGDRRLVAKTITLLESSRDDHQVEGQAILEKLVPETGKAIRVGVTGPPGVGKSTFIEGLGLYLLEQGLRVAVLAVDPSSPISGGSILGDKTRMERLAREENAFIRPSPSRGSLGGVAHRTRESLLVCEAAGFDVVIVETVGVGQSEIAVRSMSDFFAVLLQPGSGDSLQGIKRGVLELADSLIVNKADGDQMQLAERTRGDFEQALSLLRPKSSNWVPVVLTVSSLSGVGLQKIWETVTAHRKVQVKSGELASNRRQQDREWMWSLLEEGLLRELRTDPEIVERLGVVESEVAERKKTPAAAARALLEEFRKN